MTSRFHRFVHNLSRRYEGGRGAAAKANSNRDLTAAAAALVAAGVTAPHLMCLEAESAGARTQWPCSSAPKPPYLVCWLL